MNLDCQVGLAVCRKFNQFERVRTRGRVIKQVAILINTKVNILRKLTVFADISTARQPRNSNTIAFILLDVAFGKANIAIIVKEVFVIAIPETRTVVFKHCSTFRNAHCILSFVIGIMGRSIRNGLDTRGNQEGLNHFRMPLVERELLQQQGYRSSRIRSCRTGLSEIGFQDSLVHDNQRLFAGNQDVSKVCNFRFYIGASRVRSIILLRETRVSPAGRLMVSHIVMNCTHRNGVNSHAKPSSLRAVAQAVITDTSKFDSSGIIDVVIHIHTFV